MSELDKKISLNTGISWTSQYRTSHASEPRAFLVSVQALNSLLSEMGNPTNPDVCIRIYKGLDPSSNEEKLVLVGTQKDREGVYRDLLPGTGDTTDGDHNLYDFTKPCPPKCDPGSPLN